MLRAVLTVPDEIVQSGWLSTNYSEGCEAAAFAEQRHIGAALGENFEFIDGAEAAAVLACACAISVPSHSCPSPR